MSPVTPPDTPVEALSGAVEPLPSAMALPSYNPLLSDYLAELDKYPPRCNMVGLLALIVRETRPFSDTDGLLKRAHIHRKRLLQALEATLKKAPSDSLGSRSDLLQAAQQLALNQHDPSTDPVHVVAAAMHLQDPLLAPLWQKAGLQPLTPVPDYLHSAREHPIRRKMLRGFWETAEFVLCLLFFLIVIRQGLVEPRLIPSESMLPTLQIGDRVLIEKPSYLWRPYQRGDILVFYPPSTRLYHDPVSLLMRWTGFSGFLYSKEDNIDVAYIKRLIALPGDTIDVRPGQGVYINGQRQTEPYVAQLALSCTQEEPRPVCGPLKVPADSYFVMGDNRNYSFDSRYWGTLPANRVVGRAVFRIWPLARIGGVE